MTDVVNAVGFSGDTRLVSVGNDGTHAGLWDAHDGRLLATTTPCDDSWAVFTPDGRYKTANADGSFWYSIGLCRFEPGELDEFLPPGTLRRMELDAPL